MKPKLLFVIGVMGFLVIAGMVLVLGGTGRAETVAAHPNSNLAPSNLSAQVSGDDIVLSWNAPQHDTESVTGYQVLRRRPSMGERTLMVHADLPGNTATTYTDENILKGEKHTYRVKAHRLSPRSNFVNARIPRPTPTPEPTPTPAPSNEGLSTAGGALCHTNHGPRTYQDSCPLGDNIFIEGRIYGWEKGFRYTLRLDTTDADGAVVDSCNGLGMGTNRLFAAYPEDHPPELTPRSLSGDGQIDIDNCEPGDYTIIVKARTVGVEEWVSSSFEFEVEAEPAPDTE